PLPKAFSIWPKALARTASVSLRADESLLARASLVRFLADIAPFLLCVAMRCCCRGCRVNRDFGLKGLPSHTEPSGGELDKIEAEIARVGHDDAPRRHECPTEAQSVGHTVHVDSVHMARCAARGIFCEFSPRRKTAILTKRI